MLHHVLVVDDDEEVREGILLQLSDTRYTILEAEDGEKAIEILNDNALTVGDRRTCGDRPGKGCPASPPRCPGING